ncbi:hypothetical protein PAXRUDRAFT_177782, partial [Paxillus rubicundulus Ve08.2h10]
MTETHNPNLLCDSLEYIRVLQSDIVSLARQLVTACRASGQRREELSSLIRDGQDKGDW